MKEACVLAMLTGFTPRSACGSDVSGKDQTPAPRTPRMTGRRRRYPYSSPRPGLAAPSGMCRTLRFHARRGSSSERCQSFSGFEPDRTWSQSRNSRRPRMTWLSIAALTASRK